MTPRHCTRADAALPADMQPAFDRAAERNCIGLARQLGVTTHTVDALCYGGKASRAMVERVVAAWATRPSE